jgi:hypothetical protein
MRRAKSWSVGWKSTVAEIRIEPGELREVRTLQQVVDFLSDELDWPLSSADLEDIVFEYTPEELGIPKDQVTKLISLRQMRPLVTNQPWGIFFIEFSGPKLPVTVLSRLLSALVTKKRAAGDGSRKTWDLEDLLFIITTDSGDSVELHLVAFFNDDDSKPEIRSLPWRPDQSPEQHLRRLSEELLPRLAWPSESADVDGWRDAWREAFKLRHGEAFKSAASLAARMADTAAYLRDHIAEELGSEDGKGPFSDLLAEVRRELVSGADNASFADMCAQTLVYGMLTSRITDPQAFGASPTLSSVPLSNPFLAAFFEQVHDQVAEIESSEKSGLEQLIADLRESNVEAILDQFGATADGADPVIHFYENFLARYDNEARVESGAFYTPQPVVRFMVRAVDEILKERFGLLEGVADTGTWAEVAERNQFEVPASVGPNERFVSMIDPATGTGTFLVEWIKQARESFLARNSADEWPVRLAGEVLPSMHGFELMLAPYSIAHLKVVLEAQLDDGQLPDSTILLTDTLERVTAAQSFDDLADPLAAEGQRAEALKRDAHFTVAIGNPPYMRLAKEAGGGLVVHGNGKDPALFDDVVKVASAKGAFSYVASLYNLYTYFWRWTIWKVFEQHDPAPGVIAFITASSWLDGPGFVGLRELASSHADEIWVVDLGGDAHIAEQEENVFDIQTPVSIVLVVRGGTGEKEVQPSIRFKGITGSRAEKLSALSDLSLTDAPGAWEEIDSHGSRTFRPDAGNKLWHSMPALNDIFPWQQPGVMYNRTWPVSPDRATLTRRWDELLRDPDGDVRSGLLPTPATGRTVHTRVAGLPRLADLAPGAEAQPLVPYSWRAFDSQWTFLDARITALERPSLWQSLSPAQIFMIAPASQVVSSGPAATCSIAVPDKHSYRGAAGGKDVIPLYRDGSAIEPNIAEGLVAEIESRLGVGVSPEAVFAYCYALLAGAGYQVRFSEELQDKQLRLPFTADAELWQEAVALGSQLLWLHSFGQRFQGVGRGPQLPSVPELRWSSPVTTIPQTRNEIRYDPEACELHVGDGLINGVSSEVWSYEVNRWPVVRRWCEHRTAPGRGKRSSELDEIRPEAWLDGWNQELIELIAVITHTVGLRASQDDLLERICGGELIDASDLPQPDPEQRIVPPTDTRGAASQADELS